MVIHMANRIQLIEQIMHRFHAIRNQIKLRAMHLEQKNGITHSQWFVLMIIDHYKNMSIKEISEKLEMSPSAATQLVNGLVKNGYVTRREDSKDRRLVKLELSQKSRKHLSSTKERRISEMSGLFDSLTDNELKEYLRLHNKIPSNSQHTHKTSGENYK